MTTGTPVQRLLRALLRSRKVTVWSKRNVTALIAAVDAGYCRLSQQTNGNRLFDPNWKVYSGIEVTADGAKFANR